MRVSGLDWFVVECRCVVILPTYLHCIVILTPYCHCIVICNTAAVYFHCIVMLPPPCIATVLFRRRQGRPAGVGGRPGGGGGRRRRRGAVWRPGRVGPLAGGQRRYLGAAAAAAAVRHAGPLSLLHAAGAARHQPHQPLVQRHMGESGRLQSVRRYRATGDWCGATNYPWSCQKADSQQSQGRDWSGLVFISVCFGC